MVNYYKYDFVAPHRLYAEVAEEMKDWLATGAVDTLMFPRWTEHCIAQFRKTYLPICQAAVCIQDGRGELPEDFKGIRLAWATHSHQSNPFTVDGAYYYPKDYTTVTLHDGPLEGHSVGFEIETHTIIRKTTQERTYTYTCTQLLSPGMVCGAGSTGHYELDGGCIKTVFPEGVVHIQYYSDGVGDDGYQLIPDNEFVQDYIRKYLIYKLFLALFNQTTDDTFNQAERRLAMAKADMYDAKVLAGTEGKKETMAQKLHKIKKSYRKNDGYKL